MKLNNKQAGIPAIRRARARTTDANTRFAHLPVVNPKECRGREVRVVRRSVLRASLSISLGSYKNLDLINDTICTIHLVKYTSVKQPSHRISHLFGEIPLNMKEKKMENSTQEFKNQVWSNKNSLQCKSKWKIFMQEGNVKVEKNVAFCKKRMTHISTNQKWSHLRR